MTFEIICAHIVIANEIKQGLHQRDIAQTYALALRSSAPRDWPRINRLILARWPRGLRTIKQAAHSCRWRGGPLFPDVSS